MDRPQRARRTPAKESVIASVSAVMLVWAFYPRLPDQQVIHLGSDQLISVSLDDPAIKRIARLAESWDVREPVALIGKHRWASQTAQHYAQLAKEDPRKISTVVADEDASDLVITETSKNTTAADEAGEIRPVSYSIRPSTPDVPLNSASKRVANAGEGASANTPDWQDISAKHETVLENIERRVRQAKSQLQPPPVALGRRWKGPKPAITVPLAILTGSLVLAIWQWWVRHQPIVDLTAPDSRTIDDTSQPGRRSHSVAHEDLMLRLPRAWVSIHQPLNVQFRRVFTGLLFIAAVASVWTSQWSL